MRKRVLLVALLLLAALAPVASAQSGWIEGRVTDGGKPIPYANILLPETRVGVMGDSSGVFRFRAPCGYYTLRVMAMGYENADEHVVVRLKDTTRVAVVMKPVEVRREEIRTPPWWRRAPERDEKQLESQEVDEELEAIARRAGLVGDWRYRASTDTIRYDDVVLSMRYVLTEQGDSVVVNVIAEGTNVSDTPLTDSGCLSLWETRYNWGPDHFECIGFGGPGNFPDSLLFPSLDVPPAECEGARLPRAASVLHPGERIVRGMAFSFFPDAFRLLPGELNITCLYFHGKPGARWEDATSIFVGTIKIPIRPIGMPIDETCPW